MDKLIKYCVVLFCFTSCFQNKKLETVVESKDEIIPDTINSITINRGILTLNKKHSFFSNSILIYKNSFPQWIEDHNSPDFKSDDYIFKPFITDIEAPYVLYKFKNENYFYIIKNNDTLKFELGNF